MRKQPSIQESVFSAALKNLTAELLAAGRSEKAFQARYRKIRLHTFQLEFLSKFLRKSQPANLDKFEKIISLTKTLEDRLGAYNETDETAAYCKTHNFFLQSGRPAAEHFLVQRRSAYKELRTWMINDGWLGSAGDLTAVQKVTAWASELATLENPDLREFAARKMTKMLRELQASCDDEAFDPKGKSGYEMSEVEPKVHEARREIRKIPMYSSYLNGLFALTDKKPRGGQARSAFRHFAPLCQTSLAKSEFTKLPKARIKNPLLIPRPFFLAVTKYVGELGLAKDWAQNLERLREAGLKGEIAFGHLDPALKDAFGRPTPFNLMVKNDLEEIRSSRIFAVMADFFEAQE